MAELVWTEESERWLRDIFEYIALDNPDAAEAVITGIYGQILQIAALAICVPTTRFTFATFAPDTGRK
jgi:plasmid stabilization system protein ParE